MSTSRIENPRIMSRDHWLTTRKKLLAKDKRLTRERDALAAEQTVLNTHNYLDLVPQGRNQDGLYFPMGGYATTTIRRWTISGHCETVLAGGDDGANSGYVFVLPFRGTCITFSCWEVDRESGPPTAARFQPRIQEWREQK